MLASKWKLPERFVRLIRHHTQLDELLAQGAESQGAACVALASLLPSCEDTQWDEQVPFVDGFNRLIAGRNVELQELFVKVDEDASQFAPLLKLPAPAQPLVQFLK